jgi:hypothetical protein
VDGCFVMDFGRTDFSWMYGFRWMFRGRSFLYRCLMDGCFMNTSFVE